MTTYYNENNDFAAAWLRELIKAGMIAPGDVDERSIKEVKADDLKNYAQCHFFAGIGVWSYSLRRAGYPDSRRVWTGSCPCQPFSAAGKKGGFDDERHLWPEWFRLIRECRPDTIFGEQVASKDGLIWFDLVSTDLEGQDYTVGAADSCAAGVGAPHIRQRLYFVANSKYTERRPECEEYSDSHRRNGFGRSGNISALANPNGGDTRAKGIQRSGEYGQQQEDGRVDERLGNSEHNGLSPIEQFGREEEEGRLFQFKRSSTNGFWSNAEWIPCIDGKARPVEPSTFPLAHGVKNRVGLLRGYGNSLVAPVAQAFIEAYLEAEKA